MNLTNMPVIEDIRQGLMADGRSCYKVPHMVEVLYEVLQIAQTSHCLICAPDQWHQLIRGTAAPVT